MSDNSDHGRVQSTGCKREQIADVAKPKRAKKAKAPSPASFDERLRGITSFRAAMPVLDEYLSSIKVTEDDPAFLFDWNPDNVAAFAAAANNVEGVEPPQWLRTRSPNVTADSIVDDIIHELEQEAGGRCGNVMLAPNSLEQFTAIVVTLVGLQHDAFMQRAATTALPNGAQYLAATFHLAWRQTKGAKANNLRPLRCNGVALRRLFI